MKKSVKKYGTGGSAKTGDPIKQAVADKAKANSAKIQKGIDAVVRQTPAQARAFDKKKSQMAKQYDKNHPGEKYIRAIGDGVYNVASGKGVAYAGKEAGKFVGAGMKKMGEALGAKKNGGSVKKKK
jgi:hypothetical protein